ncbi:MAG: TIGR01777 family oxidoreductase [Bacteroidota bacterium]
MSNILIAGGTGLVGQRLSQLLLAEGHTVMHLSRRRNPKSAIPTYVWDLKKGHIDEEALVRADYVINLAGAGVADRRWTASRKQLIISSRVDAARLLLSSFERLGKRPNAYLSAAAIGYYGDRGEDWVNEESAPGKSGFLVESCLRWEEAIAEWPKAGHRTVTYRIGIVLSTKGGALPKMLLPARFAVASYFGDGQQYMPWIHIDDLCRMIIKGLEESMNGIYNGVAPNPVTNKVFMETLCEALGRPAIPIPAPAFALRVGMGEMADVVLSGSRVSADKIQQQQFRFEYPELLPALRDLLEKKL